MRPLPLPDAPLPGETGSPRPSVTLAGMACHIANVGAGMIGMVLDPPEAETTARRAVQIEPTDLWDRHAGEIAFRARASRHTRRE